MCTAVHVPAQPSKSAQTKWDKPLATPETIWKDTGVSSLQQQSLIQFQRIPEPLGGGKTEKKNLAFEVILIPLKLKYALYVSHVYNVEIQKDTSQEAIALALIPFLMISQLNLDLQLKEFSYFKSKVGHHPSFHNK